MSDIRMTLDFMIQFLKIRIAELNDRLKTVSKYHRYDTEKVLKINEDILKSLLQVKK